MMMLFNVRNFSFSVQCVCGKALFDDKNYERIFSSLLLAYIHTDNGVLKHTHTQPSTHTHRAQSQNVHILLTE